MSLFQDQNIILYLTQIVPILIDYLGVKEILCTKGMSKSMESFANSPESWKRLIDRDYEISKIIVNDASINLVKSPTHILSFPKDLCSNSKELICYRKIYEILSKLE